ncbi:MAG: hypothetical protein IKB50_01845 [Clostridia bacterium]|nr:hypothetical protein [Clostridia bacterium]
MAAKKDDYKYLTYQGQPLICRGNTMIYGNIADPYYVQLTALDQATVEGVEVAGNIQIALMQGMRILKTAEREGMFNAMDIAEFWLKDALEE